MTLESTDGFVRVVARRDNHLVLGWQAVGRGVSELAAAFSQSLEMGATLEDVAGTIHAHPTLGEAVQEAALRRWATRCTSSASHCPYGPGRRQAVPAIFICRPSRPRRGATAG